MITNTQFVLHYAVKLPSHLSQDQIMWTPQGDLNLINQNQSLEQHVKHDT